MFGIEGADYIYQNYTIKFYHGEKSKSLFIQPIDDNIVETNEKYNLTIASGLPYRVIVGEINTTTITIYDDDSKYACINIYVYPSI